MENLLISFNVVMPTFLILFLGYLLVQIKIIDRQFLSQANSLTFRVLLPCMLFYNIYRTDLHEVFNAKIFIFAIGSLLILFAVLCFAVPKIITQRKRQGVVIQGIFRSNYLIFGVSIVTNIFGENGATTASMLGAALIPMYNVLAVIALESFTCESKINLKNTVKSIAVNPLILATLSAMIVSLCKIPFPNFIDNTLNDISKTATPLALLVLGGDFDLKSAKGNLRLAFSTVFIKLVAVPLVFVPIAIALGFRDAELLSLAVSYSSPIAVSSYIMAQQAKADYQLAGQLVVLSSCFCLFTIFSIIFLLKQFQFI